jgi:hypothetical protein
MAMFEVREISHSNYPGRANAAPLFSNTSISIDFRPMRRSSQQVEMVFVLSTSRNTEKSVFPKTSIKLAVSVAASLLLALGQPIGFRGEWVSDSNSPPLETPPVLFPQQFN